MNPTEQQIKEKMEELSEENPELLWCPYHGLTCTHCNRSFMIMYNELPSTYENTQYGYLSVSPKMNYARFKLEGLM